jgi:hypothetical protein
VKRPLFTVGSPTLLGETDHLVVFIHSVSPDRDNHEGAIVGGKTGAGAESIRTLSVSVFRAEGNAAVPASRNRSDTSFVFAGLPHSIQDMAIPARYCEAVQGLPHSIQDMVMLR